MLALLAQHEAAVTTGQLHRVLTSYSEEGIRKVVRRQPKRAARAAEALVETARRVSAG